MGDCHLAKRTYAIAESRGNQIDSTSTVDDAPTDGDDAPMPSVNLSFLEEEAEAMLVGEFCSPSPPPQPCPLPERAAPDAEHAEGDLPEGSTDSVGESQRGHSDSR